jgi:glucokinase
VLQPQDRILGFDVGGTKSAVIVGTAEGQVVARSQFASQAQRGAAGMIADMLAHAKALLAVHGPVACAGVSIGGPLIPDEGLILSPPNLPGWDRVPLGALLQDGLGIPVRVEHDGAACAAAEYLWGGHGRVARMAYVTCGTGFGAGILVDGRPLRGLGGMPPEIGHLRYEDDGPTAFGKRGSLEAFAAASALGPIAAWRFPQRWPAAPGSEQIVEWARAGDADALAVMRVNAQAVAHACTILAEVFGVEMIVLGSSARHFGPAWVEQVRELFLEELLELWHPYCRIVPAALGATLQDQSPLAAAVLKIRD